MSFNTNIFVSRIPQSITGLDDAGMDLQAAQLSTRGGQEVRSTATLPWLDWQLPILVALCAIAGAILFTFLVSGYSRKILDPAFA